LSGCKDQHCSIKARIAGGQFEGITGLEFWIRQHRSIRMAYVNRVILVSREKKIRYTRILTNFLFI
jgi:hypothetical protein